MGHDDELRSKRLTKDEQHLIASKLLSGVTKDRIIADARNYNIDKERHPYD